MNPGWHSVSNGSDVDRRMRVTPGADIRAFPPNPNGSSTENCLGDKAPPCTRREITSLCLHAHDTAFDDFPIPGLRESGYSGFVMDLPAITREFNDCRCILVVPLL